MLYLVFIDGALHYAGPDHQAARDELAQRIGQQVDDGGVIVALQGGEVEEMDEETAQRHAKARQRQREDEARRQAQR